MRNYIILNGQNSNEITGLLIQTLPPISQPKIRTNIEEIDGRDGDIITKLGYSAYDKEISIGLYGNYNVDDIIKYFTDNQSGQVTFSDEPDKYYYYEILDQVDFDKLIRYRTATVTLHCQPFKYSTTEEKIQIDATEVSGSGSNITLDNTENGALFTSLKINGDTSQNGTPTPSAPINVDVVTGDNTIDVCGKNLLNIEDGTYSNNDLTATMTNGQISVSGTSTAISFLFIIRNTLSLQAGTYTLSANNVNSYNDGNFDLRISSKNGSTVYGRAYLNATNSKATFTLSEDLNEGCLQVRASSGDTLNNFVIIPQLEKGSSSSSYEPYVSQTYPVNLGVENLFDKNGSITDNQTYNTSGGTTALNGAFVQNDYISVYSSTAYTMSTTNVYTSTTDFRFIICEYDENKTFIKRNIGTISTITNKYTITMGSTTKYVRLGGNSVFLNELQFEKGSKANSFSPYGATPIELCKIGDYQDYIYKENGNWYKYNAVGKVVLDGSENWLSQSFGTNSWALNNVISVNYNASEIQVMSRKFKGIEQVNRNTNDSVIYTTSNNQVFIRNTPYTTLAQVQSGMNNEPLYYVLATPTTTQITDTTLLSQLEALAGATTYLGQTNIITSGSTLNPLLEVTTFAVDDPSFVITNSGNINSKPIITIYGLGTIGLYLNGIQVLSLDMGETTSQITIDVAKMEAYNQETGALMNRSVTGDYNNLSLNVGENTITESGTLQGLEIENYSRWL